MGRINLVKTNSESMNLSTTASMSVCHLLSNLQLQIQALRKDTRQRQINLRLHMRYTRPRIAPTNAHDLVSHSSGMVND